MPGRTPARHPRPKHQHPAAQQCPPRPTPQRVPSLRLRKPWRRPRKRPAARQHPRSECERLCCGRGRWRVVERGEVPEPAAGLLVCAGDAEGQAGQGGAGELGGADEEAAGDGAERVGSRGGAELGEGDADGAEGVVGEEGEGRVGVEFGGEGEGRGCGGFAGLVLGRGTVEGGREAREDDAAEEAAEEHVACGGDAGDELEEDGPGTGVC